MAVIQQVTTAPGLMQPATTTPSAGTAGSSTSSTGSTGNYQIQTAAPTTQPTPAPTATQPTQPTQPAAPTAGQQAAQAAQSFTPTTPMSAPAPLAANETVEGRLNNMLTSDSPYLKVARDSALQQINKRGLMQSSIAVGASQDAAIRNAAPIAAQDAQNEFAQNNTYNLHQYDIARVGVDTNAQSLLSSQNAAQAAEKSTEDFRLEQQKAYITLASATNDRYAQEFSEIQRSDMTAEQKTVATEELKKWKLASDNWLNQTMANFSGSSIDMGPFTGGTSGTGSQPPPATGTSTGGAYSSLASAASLPVADQVSALRTAGVPQAQLDAAVKSGIPLFKDGKYLSFYSPAYEYRIMNQLNVMPAKITYTALPQ